MNMFLDVFPHCEITSSQTSVHLLKQTTEFYTEGGSPPPHIYPPHWNFDVYSISNTVYVKCWEGALDILNH